MQAQSNCVDCGCPLQYGGRGAPRKRCDQCRDAEAERYKASRRKPDAHSFGRRMCCVCERDFSARMPNQIKCSECKGKTLCECAACGARIVKRNSAARRYANVYCDDRCKGDHYSALGHKPPRKRWLPVGPVERTAIAVSYHGQDTARQIERTFYSISCRWCSELFVSTNPRHRFCCKRHFQYQHKNGVDADLAIEVYERDDYICQLCGDRVDTEAHYNDDLAPTVDHILPKSIERIDEPWNLRTAHRRCNTVRGAKFDGQAVLAI